MQTKTKQTKRPRAVRTDRKTDWRKIEAKWQKKWAWEKAFEADPEPGKPKYFVTAAYPYVNSPQHIGHGRTYTMADVNARYHRMKGFTTLFPIGFHYTGTPIAAMSKRLSQGDHEIVETFLRIYHVPESKLDGMKDPIVLARYFHEEIRKGMKEVGFSIDWRREFSTIDPFYQRFIQWQFGKLRDKGLITQGTHPVGWCTNDNGPVGAADTIADMDPEIGEYFLVKFERDGVFLPTATLRPETAFGVTNLWINPEASYVEAVVDGEKWVVSKEAVEKLRLQNRKVDVEKPVNPKDLIGDSVLNPIAQTKVPVLPGSFVEPKNGTGVVMSVPGHAPYDYQALVDVAEDDPALKEIRPISIIRLEGYSELPAEDAVKKFHVNSQSDQKLEEATREIYSAEFHHGVMKDNTGSYAGMPVAKARDAVVADYSRVGRVDRMYEILNRPVICRCGTETAVKILQDQWFINYADPDWKKKAHECLDQMTLLPEEIKAEFDHAIDWLKEKACARRIGLGTLLPWDKDWIIEALSDSTIYMVYYILAKYLSKEWMTFKKYEKDPDKLSDRFFDHIFLGEGSAKEVADQTGVPARVLDSIRKEFEYFYPVDMRHSAKELIPNHFSFYVFNHVALFPRKYWPRGVAANGFVLMDGQKMSKSLVNIIPLRQGIEKYGADPVRIGILATAELGQDTDFSEELATSIQQRLSNILAQAKKLGRPGKARSKRHSSSLDRWILHRLNETVKAATSSMEYLRVRDVINRMLYQLDNDLAWYQRRLGPEKKSGDNRRDVLRRVLMERSKMLAPVAPHVAEEVWSQTGGKGLVSLAKWPEPDVRLEAPDAELSEDIVRQAMDDTLEVLKATGIKPSRIVYYTGPAWKWKVYLTALEMSRNKEGQPGGFMKTIMADTEIRREGKAAADYATKIFQQAKQMREDQRSARLKTGPVDESKTLADAKDFYEREFRVKVDVWKQDDSRAHDPKGRARLAEPYRPAIYIE